MPNNASPTTTTVTNMREGFWTKLLGFLLAGIANDRPRVFLGSEKVNATGTSAPLTFPTGTEIIHVQVADAGDCHINWGGGDADTSDFLYRAGNEYWIDLQNAPAMAAEVIRNSASVDVFFEYWRRG